MPNDDSDPNATQMLQTGEADAGSRPPIGNANVGADSLNPNAMRETIVHGPDKTRLDSAEIDQRASESEVNISELNTNFSRQETGEFSDAVHNAQLTGTIGGNEATGEFSVTGATVNRPGTRRGTQVNTVRSGGAGDTEIAIPETVGNYEIKRVLGRGGMGVVYLARQVGLNRDVALKMVLAGAHASKNQLARFEAEACAVARLQHPNIVQVFEVDRHEGLPYFSLEYVDGMSLDQRIDGKPLPPREAAQIVEKICRAMHYAHDRGILHRDLKPANILMTQDGQPKVTDFGLAKQLENEDSLTTRAGTIMGTPSYMSPEQAQGLVDELRPASDQYSLGALLYELLTGRPPFLGTKVHDTISQVVHKEPVPPCQLQEKLPVDIDTICLKALQKTPEKRYASCEEMADDLGRFLRSEPIRARPISKQERFVRWCKRNPVIAGLSAVAIGLLVTTAFITTWSYLQISAQAAIIADERDNANEQRDEANKQREEANKQKLVAIANEETAQKERDEAQRQRILAQEAKARAEENEKLAEQQAVLALKNIQFIVTDVDDRLAKQAGMSQLRVDLLKVVEKKWDELDVGLTGGIKGQAIPTLMAVRAKIADAWLNLDKLQEADAQYEAIHKQAQQRVIDKNRNDASRLNLALVGIKWSAVRQRLTGDPAEGEKIRSVANDLLRDIIKNPKPELLPESNKPDPNSPAMYQISDALQQSLLQSASVATKSGKLDQALANYQEVEQVNQAVVEELEKGAAWYEAMPEDRKLLVGNYFKQNMDLGKSGQANLLVRQGKVELAIPIYEQIIAKQEKSYETQPNDANVRDQLALQYRNFGQNMLRSNRAEDAVKYVGKAHDLTEKNYHQDPTNAKFKKSHGYSLYYWGVARDAVGQKPDALALFERSRALRQEMFEASPDQSNKVDLMLSEAQLGNAENCLKLIKELATITAKNPDLRLDLARALVQLAKASDEVVQKESLTTQAFDALAKAIDEGLVDPFAITSEIDLSPIRSDERFNQTLAAIKK